MDVTPKINNDLLMMQEKIGKNVYIYGVMLKDNKKKELRSGPTFKKRKNKRRKIMDWEESCLDKFAVH